MSPVTGLNRRRIASLLANLVSCVQSKELGSIAMSGGINQIGANAVANQLAAESQETGQADTKQGVVVQSRGQEIQTQPSQGSLIQQAIQDSAEEVTMMFQDKSADRLKRRDAKSRSSSRINEVLQKYLKSVGNVTKAEKFQKLTESLKQLQKPTPDQIRDLLDEFHGGTSEDGFEAATLLALEELFSTDAADADVLAAIREVKSELGQELSDFYKQTVSNYDGVSDVYEQLLGEHGEGDFLKATETLITRLGGDLQSQGASVDSTKVKATVDSLYHLEVARNTFTSFAQLLTKMDAQFTTGTI